MTPPRMGLRQRYITTVTIAVAAIYVGLVGLAPLGSGTALAAPRSDADPSLEIDVGGTGRTLIAGVKVGEPTANESRSCVWRTTEINDQKYAPFSIQERNGVTYRWYARICRADTPAGGFDASFHWIPLLSESTMASQATKYAFGVIPVPLVGTSPPAHRGVVTLPTWWWVSPSSWRTVSVSVWIPTPTGPFVVRATAKPERLIIDPADPKRRDGGRFTCSGPGIPWRPALGDDAVGPCMHTYTHAVRGARAEVSIDWSISWKSNRGGAGRLPNRRTTRVIRVTVGEIQALVTN